MPTSPADAVPFIPWADFYRDFKWKQSEHITCLGPTGSGKTTLLFSLLHKRTYNLVFATKPKDPLILGLKRQGYYVTDEKLPPPELEPKVVLWPRISSPDDVPNQRRVFDAALRHVYRVGGWTLCLDEVRYQTQYLGLERLVDLLWQHGRSNNISMVVGAQRPAWIPLSAYDQASHLFIWRFRSPRDLKLLSALGTIDVREVTKIIGSLPEHEALYINAVHGTMLRTKVEVPRK